MSGKPKLVNLFAVIRFFFAFIFLALVYDVKADYVYQILPSEPFESVSRDIIWNNNSAETDYPMDDDYQRINLGFTFYLGETGYSQVKVLANGALHFGADQGFHKDYTNESLPITTFINGPGFEEAADRAILGYWDDLEPSLGGTVRYDIFGTAPSRYAVFSWENVPRYNSPNSSYSFQIAIYENGDIRFKYGNDDVTGSSATVGIEIDNNDFTEFSFNTTSIDGSFDILWTREFPTISRISTDCATPTSIVVNFTESVSPARALDPNNYSINNAISIYSAVLLSPTEVELVTDMLNPGISYTLTTSLPNQSVIFSLADMTTETFADNFNSSSFANNDGTGTWASDWVEIGDNNSASSGRIVIAAGELYMNDLPNSGGQPQLQRSVDLSSFSTATFSLDYRTFGNLEFSDRFDVSISSNGGLSYSILKTYNDDVTGSDSFDITPFISNNMTIRLRIENNYGGGSEYIVIDNVLITGTRIQQCASSVDHFRIQHDNAAINCLREAITIRAENVDDSLTSDFTGIISLSTSTNNGNWFVVDSNGLSNDPALGTLTEVANDNDGAATYEFASGDLGSVTLYLQNTQAESVNIAAAEGAILDENTEGNLVFRPFGFVFSPSPITTQIAGRPFDITLTAAGQTPSDPECGVIEEYTGSKSINFWSTYNSPLTSPTLVTVNGNSVATSEPASSAQTVVFTNGVATVSTQYNDAGQISLSAKDEIDVGEPPSGNLDEIIGGISPFVVRPFAYDIQVAGNPNATNGNSPVFQTVDNVFSTTLRSVLWQAADDLDNDGQADSNSDLSNNAVTPNISQFNATVSLSPTAQVVTNSNGSLSAATLNLTNFVSAGLPDEGTLTFDQSWNEVGILQLQALTSDFLGSGENLRGTRSNIGRFIPDHFLLNQNTIVAQCGGFTFGGFFDGINAGLDKSGQLFTVSGDITAQNTSNNTTQNYAGEFAKLTSADVTAAPYNSSSSSSASGRLRFAPSAFTFTAGTTSFTDLNSDYQFNTFSDQFSLRIDVSATDSDNVSSGLVSSNSFETRLGRLRLIDAYSPETDDVEMRLISEFYSSGLWQTNTSDSCSNYVNSSVSFDLASYTDQLNDGETSVFAPNSLQTVVSGLSSSSNGLWFTAPGAGNFGSVLVQYDLSSQPWLAFDWTSDQTNDSAQARLNFGYYRGSDRIIYWREIRN